MSFFSVSVRSSPFFFLIFSGVSREISQGPKCTFQIWKCAVIGLLFFPLASADVCRGGLRHEPKERLRGSANVAAFGNLWISIC